MLVLLCKDQGVFASQVKRALARAGHQVLGPVSTMSHALDLASRSRPDIALIDTQLKTGARSVGLARELMRRWQVPTLFIGSKAVACDDRDAGIGMVRKPMDMKTLMRSIEAAKQIADGLRPATSLGGLELFSGKPCSREH